MVKMDIEFGYENKKFASAKVAATGEPIMSWTDPLGEPKIERPKSNVLKPGFWVNPVLWKNPGSTGSIYLKKI